MEIVSSKRDSIDHPPVNASSCKHELRLPAYRIVKGTVAMQQPLFSNYCLTPLLLNVNHLFPIL